jgi:hypothetical protein
MNLSEIRKMIIDQMPPEARFSASDAETFAKNRELLRSWREDLVQGFYDLMFSHQPTREIFHEGERPAREGTLRDWWDRVVEGPIDDKFWNWMTYVGLMHVLRKVKNPMMLIAWGAVMQQVITKSEAALSPTDANQLVVAFTRFGQTLTSLVAESYLQGIADATGTSLALLENLASQQIGSSLTELKESL